jgi:hypothetical protein
MADTAAFFASKKKKGTKKKFKAFNANKIDANSVLSSKHVDAPEMSEGVSGLSLGGAREGNNDDWDESQGVVWGGNAAATNSGADSKVSELLDMQALQVQRNEEDDVAERMRVEETKAQLARAKEGMAKEAERLAAAKAQKETKAAERAAGGPASGGRWVPAHMRSTGVGTSSLGGGGLSSANEELFPDLAAADKILADKERQEDEERKRMASSQPIRAPSGWGSRGGSAATTAAPAQRKALNLAPAPAERKPLNLNPAAAKPEAADTKETVVEKKEEKPATDSTPPAAATPASAAAATPTPEPVKKKVLKKKKKKDLSSFKA